jgi:hypothetical protein
MSSRPLRREIRRLRAMFALQPATVDPGNEDLKFARSIAETAAQADGEYRTARSTEPERPDDNSTRERSAKGSNR